MIISLIVGLIKRYFYIKISYFLPFRQIKNKIEVELELPDYATKSNVTNLKSEVDKLEKVQSGLSSLKSKVDKVEVDKLAPVPKDLSKLSNVVKNDVVEKDVYNAKIKDIEDKMLDNTNLATNSVLNAKVNEFKNEIPNITNLVTASILTALKNNIRNVSDLVKKADYYAEIKDVKEKVFTASDYDKFMNNILDVEITGKRLVNESGLNNTLKTLVTKEEIKTLATKTELKAEQDKMAKTQMYDFSLFIGQSYLFNNEAQLNLIFQRFFYT